MITWLKSEFRQREMRSHKFNKFFWRELEGFKVEAKDGQLDEVRTISEIGEGE